MILKKTQSECDSIEGSIIELNMESELLLKHAEIVASFEKEINDYPIYECCSCNCLHQRKSVTKVKLCENLGKEIWPRLKNYIIEHKSFNENEVFFMCNYCKSKIKHEILPARCVLNGLEIVPIPQELKNLDSLSCQLIQLAKCYQTIIRLGTYTAKVPMYNSLKACKGTMFFLPLPFSKTVNTLDNVNSSTKTILPNPELYIIINGKPTKGKVVWRSLVNIHKIRAAIKKLKEINWLYKNIENTSLDRASNEIIESVLKTTSTMLVKATENDLSTFQSYTIRNLDNKLSSTSDIEQYKILNIQESPLDTRQQHLDVLCFPVLFPTGMFGEFYPREVKLSKSEYIKSRLLNKDPRFRKNPQYVFFLLWQKELQELTAGVYNVLKSSKSKPFSVGALLEKMSNSDNHLEAHLCTMLQSVRGTKQYWFLRQSELRCMIRNWGPPTLFLTFSCAEYESPDIIDYLQVVNNVPTTYDIGKLCTEDPISVSQKFSLKFHAFFKRVLIKGSILGTVNHFYWKKEYQARGAPHYHVLLWIEGAPMIGQDDPKIVLAWIQNRITCHLPNKENNPELNRLVTRYQMHKCSTYCKRKYKYGKGTFITRCKFGFPRQVCDFAKINSVDDSLKARKKIYNLQRSQKEVQINDYNSLLLLLWKANIDIQFIAESSFALAHYVSGYVTKAEKSTMQDIWNDISSNKNIYSRLWSFGIRSLHSRECGLYEASDLLLGDHLYEKSDTVKWIDVSMPHKRSRRLKNYKVLLEMEKQNPNSEEIFQDNLIDTFYPKRPHDLEKLCLYDFVANYDCMKKNNERVYKKFNTPRLINHKIFDPEKETEREDYFYSLVLLFVPFSNEQNLLLENEMAEQAFHRLLPADDQCSAYHATLQKMLKANYNVKKINEIRNSLQEEKRIEHDDEPQLIGEAKAAMEDISDLNLTVCNNFTVKEREALLNPDQKRVYNTIKSHLIHQLEHENKTCECNLKPIRMFVSGVGGTGKSFLIESIKILISNLWPTENLTCAIAAPTGLAAFNVGGVTIHRLFQLPIDHDSCMATYWPLPKSSQKIMKTTLQNVKMFIIDEISMVSSLNLVYIHLRLDELFGSNDWFGSKNMLFVGDILQLQPVSGNPVFEKVTNKLLVQKIGCITAVNIWKDAIKYDELIINERQKKDTQFSSLLHAIRCGQFNEEVQTELKKKIIQKSVTDHFIELTKHGQNPVCLFPTKKQCSEFNMKMLSYLNSDIHAISCIDEIDETMSTQTWTKKAAKCLEKVKSDCSLTAGLETTFHTAVGARVMLRRNIDTKMGLVNGALGSVQTITHNYITVKFDHIDEPFRVEMVKSRFTLMRNFHIYRKQFPLILAYAITVHKCQGLSLDCAIIDLSNKIFAAGMAYVALSRVRSLANLHLSAFDSSSIKVSLNCLKEVNRLRETYRSDLPIFPIPASIKISKKRKLISRSDVETPSAKKTHTSNNKMISSVVTNNPVKNILPQKGRNNNLSKISAKKTKLNQSDTSEIEICFQSSNNSTSPLKYYQVNEEWQHNACSKLHISFIKSNRVSPGGPSISLTSPNPYNIKPIVGDGNCLFRSFSYVITGSEDQHMKVRKAIISHMYKIGHLLIGPFITEDSIEEYIQNSGMDQDKTWGTYIEMLTFSHLSQTSVLSYDMSNNQWVRYCPHALDKNITDDFTQMSIYLRHPPNHFEVVRSILK